MHKLASTGRRPRTRSRKAARATDEGESWAEKLLPTDFVVNFRLARYALLAFLLIWGVRLAAMDVTTGELIVTSCIHNSLILIHEAGHIIFALFGEFLRVAGGSLLQLLLPLSIVIACVYINRDPYAAGVCTWWLGSSFLDLAPYIYDAIDPNLMLLSGATGREGGHDWIYLLEQFNFIHGAHALARVAQIIGVLLMLLGLLWAWLGMLHGRSDPLAGHL